MSYEWYGHDLVDCTIRVFSRLDRSLLVVPCKTAELCTILNGRSYAQMGAEKVRRCSLAGHRFVVLDEGSSDCSQLLQHFWKTSAQFPAIRFSVRPFCISKVRTQTWLLMTFVYSVRPTLSIRCSCRTHPTDRAIHVPSRQPRVRVDGPKSQCFRSSDANVVTSILYIRISQDQGEVAMVALKRRVR